MRNLVVRITVCFIKKLYYYIKIEYLFNEIFNFK